MVSGEEDLLSDELPLDSPVPEVEDDAPQLPVPRSGSTTDLVPYDALVADDYETFLLARAKRVHSDMLMLCEGAIPA